MWYSFMELPCGLDGFMDMARNCFNTLNFCYRYFSRHPPSDALKSQQHPGSVTAAPTSISQQWPMSRVTPTCICRCGCKNSKAEVTDSVCESCSIQSSQTHADTFTTISSRRRQFFNPPPPDRDEGQLHIKNQQDATLTLLFLSLQPLRCFRWSHRHPPCTPLRHVFGCGICFLSH